jgi:hypothetical protein
MCLSLQFKEITASSIEAWLKHTFISSIINTTPCFGDLGHIAHHTLSQHKMVLAGNFRSPEMRTLTDHKAVIKQRKFVDMKIVSSFGQC